MLFRSSFRFLLLCATPLAFAFSPACSTPATTDACTDGNEGCPCFTNGTCNDALRCLSNLCVADDSQTSGGAGASSTGSPTGASGSMTNGGSTSTGTAMGGSSNTAGTQTGGGTPGAAGMPGGGGSSAAGDGSTGGSSAAAGSTSGGGADCGDTSSDPQNCGSCGHACRETYAGACADGLCQPSYAGCFLESEFTNCSAFCMSIGETCVERGCTGGVGTWELYSSTTETCTFQQDFIDYGDETCAAAPVWHPGDRARCCCTDTQ